ncbi:hypothetical protein WR25_21569 [Diploscapter pachys]|uniref:DRBM domain-containing protein n=1 Tax=Diploscapter pachys TaxID=2018661 RepID=A0A2A2KQ57_9BILA|nr:hypothetical protein WR25_21569 [Diploscapter pachys]
MSLNFDDFFTPADRLRETEPEYFQPCVFNPNASESKQNEPVKKTALAVFNEGVVRVLGPNHNVFKLKEEQLEPNSTVFKIEGRFKDALVVCEGKTKKIAQQKTAKKLLYEIVEMNDPKLLSDFFLPEDKEEARKFIDKLVVDVDDEKLDEEVIPAECSNMNFIGDLQTVLQQQKLPKPEYNETDNGNPTNMIFTVTCKVNKRETVGVAKKKKEAKTIAAYKMYNLIVTRQLDLNAGPALDSPDEENHDQKAETETPKENDEPKRPDDKPLDYVDEVEKKLKELFKDEALMPTYTILERPNINKEKDCIMKLQIPVQNSGGDAKKKQSTGPDSVFCGSGKTDSLAKQNAAQVCFNFLKTY